MPVTYRQAGEQIAARRKALKLSMRAAAQLGGVSPTAWSDLEAGKHPPTDSTQLAVCRALGWTPDSIDRLLAGKKPKLAVSSPSDDDGVERRFALLEQGLDLIAAHLGLDLPGGPRRRASDG